MRKNISYKKTLGDTLENMGRRWGVTRERIRQRIQRWGTADPTEIAERKLKARTQAFDQQQAHRIAAAIETEAQVSEQRARFRRDHRSKNHIHQMFAHLPTGTKVINLCDRLGIQDLHGITAYSAAQLMSKPQVGKSTIQQIRVVLAEVGYQWY